MIYFIHGLLVKNRDETKDASRREWRNFLSRVLVDLAGNSRVTGRVSRARSTSAMAEGSWVHGEAGIIRIEHAGGREINARPALQRCRYREITLNTVIPWLRDRLQSSRRVLKRD